MFKQEEAAAVRIEGMNWYVTEGSFGTFEKNCAQEA